MYCYVTLVVCAPQYTSSGPGADQSWMSFGRLLNLTAYSIELGNYTSVYVQSVIEDYATAQKNMQYKTR